MQTHYTVTKTSRDAEPQAVEVERREGLTWNEAAAFAVELGAVPGSGECDGMAFRTNDPVELVRITTG